MADELDAQKAFLTWEESAAVLQTDASQGIARAQRLLAMRYLRRAIPPPKTFATLGTAKPRMIKKRSQSTQQGKPR